MHELRICKATDSEGGTLDIDGQNLDDVMDPNVVLPIYENDAKTLERFLRDTLPGGTYDRLLGEMLARKASLFNVKWGQEHHEYGWGHKAIEKVVEMCAGTGVPVRGEEQAVRLLEDSTLVPGIDGLESIHIWVSRFIESWATDSYGMTESERYYRAVNKASWVGG